MNFASQREVDFDVQTILMASMGVSIGIVFLFNFLAWTQLRMIGSHVALSINEENANRYQEMLYDARAPPGQALINKPPTYNQPMVLSEEPLGVNRQDA